MTRHRRTTRILLLACLAALPACGGEVESSRTSLEVVTRSTGAADPDGYVLSLGARRWSLVPNGEVEFRGIEIGAHDVRLDGLAPGCAVASGPEQVVLEVGRPGRLELHVECDAAVGDLVVPGGDEWTEHGPVMVEGEPGNWARRLDGMISPAAAMKRDGVYFLYFVGADGDRSTDGGPRHRVLGVALSDDGLDFRSYEGNPILTHAPHGNEEEGIFSAGVARAEDGTVVLYYGTMTAPDATSESVDGEAVVAFSADGLSFSDPTVVVSPRDTTVYNDGDEIFPVGAFAAPGGGWHVYYIGKGREGLWTLGLAMGPAPDRMERTTRVLDLRPDWIVGGGDPVRIADDRIAVPLVINYSSPGRILEWRTAAVDRPWDLGTVADRYVLPMQIPVVLLDREEERWLMYYLNAEGTAIEVRSAPLRRREPGS